MKDSIPQPAFLRFVKNATKLLESKLAMTLGCSIIFFVFNENWKDGMCLVITTSDFLRCDLLIFYAILQVPTIYFFFSCFYFYSYSNSDQKPCQRPKLSKSCVVLKVDLFCHNQSNISICLHVDHVCSPFFGFIMW